MTAPLPVEHERLSPRAAAQKRPRVGVVKFASCDGCQLSLLDCEDELLAVAGAVNVSRHPTRLSLIEKSIAPRFRPPGQSIPAKTAVPGDEVSRPERNMAEGLGTSPRSTNPCV